MPSVSLYFNLIVFVAKLPEFGAFVYLFVILGSSLSHMLGRQVLPQYLAVYEETCM